MKCKKNSMTKRTPCQEHSGEMSQLLMAKIDDRLSLIEDRRDHCLCRILNAFAYKNYLYQPFHVKRNLSLRNRIEKWDPLSPRMLSTTTTPSLLVLTRRIGRRKVVAYEDGNLSPPTTNTVPTTLDQHHMDCVHRSFLFHPNH
jgi:hypothetical protein